MDRPRLLTPDRQPGLTRRGMFGLGAAAASALLLPGCSRGRADEPAPSEAATFVTGNKGGVYYEFGAALSTLVSEVTGMELKPMPSNGSVQNLVDVATGKAELGFCTSDSALAAYEGSGQFSGNRLKFSALARVYDNYVHVVVPMASKAKSLQDLNPDPATPARKMTVSVGPKKSGTQIVADMILDAAGVDVTRVNLTLEQSVTSLQNKADGTSKSGIDAFIWSGGVPTAPIAGLQKSTGFRLLDIGTVAEKIALEKFGGFVVSSIPPSQYGLASSVPTLAVPNYLIAKPNLSDSWAWWTVNTLFRRQNDLIPQHPEAGALDPRSAIATMPVPLHPAAERWYRQNHI
ncbi:TAXI family TRAP transporter solute-binding subunit [Kribbella solani]|uniref:TRAP transporter TAXI family solute receptor n=1 Tax=Kribbella solani TaxID=236067 RepID=A0A841DSY3_9ACTN|nr:TAXI family TRAP transporter solute-binding subunit [Kribbella solani]MBB5981099.1 TRAP transporter TAXI family solute receptor [Kribbella solani]MDX2970446.1 TAXI family TRAP transporter solute-binding subunit [Kribbella solani]MDX3003672.1 TAXI family TRAP transporter solute-binding subunit [Kribbella solani]